jgi:ABC-type Fe3+-citrate transport system substrate-binding protein
LEEAGSGDEENSEVEEFLGVADFLGKEEKKAAGNENHGKEIGSEAEEKKKDSPDIGSGRAHEIVFGLESGFRVEGQVLGIKGEKGKEKKDASAEDGQGNDFLAEAGSGGMGFGFGHG